MKKMFVVEFKDPEKQKIVVSGKGRQSVSMKVVGVRMSKAIGIKSITEQKSTKD